MMQAPMQESLICERAGNMQASIILEQMDLGTPHSLKVHKQVWPPLYQGTQRRSMCNSLVADSNLFNGCKGACRPAKVSRRIGAPEGLRGVSAQLVMEQVPNICLEGLPRQLQRAAHTEAARSASSMVQRLAHAAIRYNA